ncbi:MAG: hypothetical protein HY650_03190 [Acidobacteria bacterium]|nr:hypothetical protein [Acidobacteriota bacterium]
MRIALWILTTLGAILAGFGWWGTKTTLGRQAFDEMAGIIPFAAGAFGTILLITAVLLWTVQRLRR